MNSLRTKLVIAAMILLMAIAPSCALQTTIHPTSARLQRPFVVKYQSPQRPLYPKSTFRSRNLQLSSSTFDDEDSPPYFKGDSLVLDTSRSLRRISWFSWWSQVILTSVSSVIILFARNVVKVADRTQSLGTDGFFLAGSSIVASVLSIIWTWGGARLARRLKKRNTTRIRAANMTRKAIKVGVSLNIVGMFLSLVGAEQIVGMLAVKVLTMQGVLGNPATLAVATQTLQPLDILVVQANTNTMLSHFVSLVCGLYLTKFVDKLDPPSVEDDERKRK